MTREQQDGLEALILHRDALSNSNSPGSWRLVPALDVAVDLLRADMPLAREAAIARAERAELELDEVKREASEQAAKLSLLVSAVEAVLNKADVEGIREWRCIRALRRVLEGAK